MKTFEIHITAEKTIRSLKNLKTISLELFQPNGCFLKEEHMTSMIKKYESAYFAIEDTLKLSNNLKSLGIDVYRTKIECPPYPEYLDKAIYVESHFEVSSTEEFPTSRNLNKSTLLGTEREYNKINFENFLKFSKAKGRETEICIYDDNIKEDEKWFSFYNYFKNKQTSTNNKKCELCLSFECRGGCYYDN